MASGEEHVCIGCGIHVTCHRSQMCQWCRGGETDRPSPVQTMSATDGRSADPREYPQPEPEPFDQENGVLGKTSLNLPDDSDGDNI